MNLDLTGKRAVVTGSTAGIGFAIAKGLTEAGAHVVVNGRTQARVDAAKQEIKAALPAARIDGIAADLSNAAGVAAFIKQAPEADILVNNLGIYEQKPFASITDEDWQRFFDANVMSGIRMSRHYLPGMLKRDWGRIVFISSESGIHIPVEMVHYGMTKTAQLAVSRGLAESVAGTGVTVNSVLPGPTRSEAISLRFAKVSKEQGISEEEQTRRFITERRPTSLIKRLATTEEVANMVVYVCSPAASATTGAALRVDGGVVRTIA